jgi:Ca2+-binding RTX toxin-like protein
MRKRLLLGGIVAAALVALAGIASAAKVTVTQSPAGKIIHITGTNGDDTIEIENIAGLGNPMERFYEIHDPDGIPNPIPPGCFRFDANTIHCPVAGTAGFEIDLKDGDDELVLGENILDELDVEGGGGDDDIEGGEDGDDLEGEGGRDVLDGNEGPDDREGGPGNDRLLASPGNDRQFGGGGNDFLGGGPGKDIQNGGAGRDRLFGNGGRDRQNGGPGRDTCNGGPANDSAIRCEVGANY